MRILRKRYGPEGAGLADSFLWMPAVSLAAYFRNDFDYSAVDWVPVLMVGSLALFAHFIAVRLASLWGRKFANKVGSFQDVREGVGISLIAATPLAFAVVIWGPQLDVPRSLIFLAFPIFLVGSLAFKILWRLSALRRALRSGSERALIYGAGEVGALVLSQLLADSNSHFRPVGFVDDNASLHGRKVAGLEVLGSSTELPKLLLREKVDAVIIAIPAVDSSRVRNVEAVCSPQKVKVLIVPSILELLRSKETQVPLRKVDLEDLIGRRSVDVDISEIAPHLTERRILVTGAGGSIGVELCRQLSRLAPRQLIMLDRDETALQFAALEVGHSGLLDSPNLVLADIRDPLAIRRAFENHRPEVVLHAAALKHVTTLERFPDEAWKTNVLGTLNVLEASRLTGVRVFINISTDKAAAPTSVLGKSKSIAEGLTAWFGEDTGRAYSSVRFGNVFGSRGSLVPLLNQLIEKGGPVQITDRDATRYFMSVGEACLLVLKAATMASSGEVFVLDMGAPVRILDVAEKLIALSGKTINIEFTGLRDGEKLHEVLYSTQEKLGQSEHPLISKVVSKCISPTDLALLASEMGIATEKR